MRAATIALLFTLTTLLFASLASADRPTQQIFIQTQFLEIDHDELPRFGIDFGNITGPGDLPIATLPPAILDDLESMEVPVLANPTVTTVNGQPATVTVGERIQIPESTDFLDLGVDLQITPQIAPDDSIRLDIQATTPTIVPTELPELSTNQLTTTVTVPDGSTVAIGGLLQDDAVEVGDQVPWLGDIPTLGQLFRQRDAEQARRRELLVFITPRIRNVDDEGSESAPATPVADTDTKDDDTVGYPTQNGELGTFFVDGNVRGRFQWHKRVRLGMDAQNRSYVDWNPKVNASILGLQLGWIKAMNKRLVFEIEGGEGDDITRRGPIFQNGFLYNIEGINFTPIVAADNNRLRLSQAELLTSLRKDWLFPLAAYKTLVLTKGVFYGFRSFDYRMRQRISGNGIDFFDNELNIDLTEHAGGVLLGAKLLYDCRCGWGLHLGKRLLLGGLSNRFRAIQEGGGVTGFARVTRTEVDFLWDVLFDIGVFKNLSRNLRVSLDGQFGWRPVPELRDARLNRALDLRYVAQPYAGVALGLTWLAAECWKCVPESRAAAQRPGANAFTTARSQTDWAMGSSQRYRRPEQ